MYTSKSSEDTLLDMNLSTSLINKILSHPTNTTLRDTYYEESVQFSQLPKSRYHRDINIPDTFDGRKVWEKFLSPVKNQGNCGSCWAFASTSCLADRFNIQSEGMLHVDLSPAKLILCDFMGKEFNVKHPEKSPQLLAKIDMGSLSTGACHGNSLLDPWRYMYTIGTTKEECTPYDKSLGGELKYNSLSSYEKDDKLPLCATVSGPIGDMCSDFVMDNITAQEDGTPARFYRCLHYYAVAGTKEDGGDEHNIRHNIYTWGPVSTAMNVYPDFYTFDPKTQIYEWDKQGVPVGGHAIELVGWGSEKGKDFWWVRNSWGENWGIGGFFKISRGNNMCKIEENVLTGVPDFFYPPSYSLDSSKFIWLESPQDISRHLSIVQDRTITGGGIDPETGYTRRIKVAKPWLDISPVIDWKKLPDWKTFIAGQVLHYTKKTRKKILRWFFLVFSVFSVIAVIIAIVYLKK